MSYPSKVMKFARKQHDMIVELLRQSIEEVVDDASVDDETKRIYKFMLYESIGELGNLFLSYRNAEENHAIRQNQAVLMDKNKNWPDALKCQLESSDYLTGTICHNNLFIVDYLMRIDSEHGSENDCNSNLIYYVWLILLHEM